jgi:hypothetical protein
MRFRRVLRLHSPSAPDAGTAISLVPLALRHSDIGIALGNSTLEVMRAFSNRSIWLGYNALRRRSTTAPG